MKERNTQIHQVSQRKWGLGHTTNKWCQEFNVNHLDDKGRYALQVSVTIRERKRNKEWGRAVGTAEPRPTGGTIHSSRQKRHEHSLVDATKVQGCKEEPEDQDIPLSSAKHRVARDTPTAKKDRDGAGASKRNKMQC